MMSYKGNIRSAYSLLYCILTPSKGDFYDKQKAG